MATIALRLPCVLCALSWLAGCAPLAAMVGYSGSAIKVATALDRIKLASDGVSYLGSGKTITDHAVSMVVGADCRLLNAATPRPLCRPAQDTTADNTNPQTQVAAAPADSPVGAAPAAAAAPYDMDGTLIAGYRHGMEVTPADP